MLEVDFVEKYFASSGFQREFEVAVGEGDGQQNRTFSSYFSKI
jgi:hypothetical protein